MDATSSPSRGTRDDVKRALHLWRDREDHFRIDGYRGTGPVDSVRRIKGCGAATILTAPHAVKHMRDGKTKSEDRGTGSLCEALAVVLSVDGIAVSGPQAGDPNWDDTPGPFKLALFELLRPDSVVIDLHGMKDEHGVDVCIGRGGRPDARSSALAERLVASFESVGLRAAVDRPFRGARPSTITSSAQARGACALQIEISRRLRAPERDEHSASLILDGLLSVLTPA